MLISRSLKIPALKDKDLLYTYSSSQESSGLKFKNDRINQRVQKPSQNIVTYRLCLGILDHIQFLKKTTPKFQKQTNNEKKIKTEEKATISQINCYKIAKKWHRVLCPGIEPSDSKQVDVMIPVDVEETKSTKPNGQRLCQES